MNTVHDQLDVLSIGETMALLVAMEPGPLAQVQHFSKRLAGADSNVSIGLARLGFKVGWVSRVGADSMGTYVRQAIEAEGVDTSHVEVDSQRSTGFMLKSRSLDGSDPAIEYYRRNSAASQLTLANLPASYLMKTRHIHTTGITPALSSSAYELVAHAMKTLRSAGRTVSFDPNLRPTLWPSATVMRATLNELATYADWVLPGVGEGQLLTGQATPADIAAWYLDRGVKAVIVKLGQGGAYFRTASGEQGEVPAISVPLVVDTVGAGDAFAVGIISAQLEGLTWPDALRRANWVASCALQVIGDMEGLPTRSEMTSKMAKTSIGVCED